MEKRNEDFVNVCVRIKPVLNQYINSSLQIISNEPAILVVPERSLTYSFDHIFTEDIEQDHIYNETVKPLVDKVKQGYNCTVFTYGQTGTGKTYTMGTNSEMGTLSEQGLIPRSLNDLFNVEDENEVDIFISFIEIYNEKVFDLLSNENKVPLVVKGFKACSYEQVRVNDTYEARHFLDMGNKNRHTGETKQNANSSRSHAIFTIYCNSRNSTTETTAKLNLVDLAGCESVKKTGTQGNTFHEGININKGLLCIGQVMTALSSNSSHIPYRQSIITTILQDSLNKKNFVSLIACVSCHPEDTNETVQTLEFSHRVKKMKNKPEVNAVISKYKNDNPILFSTSRTPFKRPNSTPLQSTVKKMRNNAPLGTILEPSVNSTADNSSKSLFSFSMSSEATQQYLSPVIKKYMTAMESSLLNKLEAVIQNTLKRQPRRSLRHVDKENTPDTYNWNKIQSEVSKLVKTEMQQFTVKAARAASSPIDNDSSNKIRRVLSYDSPDFEIASEDNKENSGFQQFNLKNEKIENVYFKVPLLPTNKINKDTPALTRKSKRLSMRNSNINNNCNTDVSLNNVKDTSYQCTTIKNISSGFRRSVRLSMKQMKRNEVDLDQTNMSTLGLSLLEQSSHIFNDNNNSLEDFNGSNRNKIIRENVKPKNVKKQSSTRNKPKSKTNSPLTTHNKNVLHILNKGNIKQLEKLHTVGPKTAQQILLYRQLKGSFTKIVDLSDMPGWTDKKLDRFLTENFLI